MAGLEDLTPRQGGAASVDSPAAADFVARCTVLAERHFGISTLRPAQRGVLERVHGSPGVLATLPTGAGKTLLYALPALALGGGPVVVVCPLIALMRDQVRRMTAAGVPAVLFTGDQSEEERRASYVSLFTGQARLVFVSPERFVLPSFERALVKCTPSMVVVDEAHCVVSWGHAFRPEYKLLGRVLERLAPPRILALTATASRQSRRIIHESVFPAGFKIEEVAHPPLAPNVFVEAIRVYSENEKWEILSTLVRGRVGSKAIVYLPKRTACEEMVRNLRRMGVHSIAYHAGLRKQERLSVEDYLHKTKEATVVCATQAFGMGVDLPDVDLVVVYGFPANVEEYFQMVGRAGRRGTPARSVLLWSGSDPKRRTFQFEESYPDMGTLREELACVDPLLPVEGSVRVVPSAALARSLESHGLKSERKLPGLVAALRYLGVLENPLHREPCLWIRLDEGKSADDLLLALPPGVTRRSLCLGAVCRESLPRFRHARGAETVLPVKLLCDDLQWPLHRVEEVLAHFASKGELRWGMLGWEELQESHLLIGNTDLLRKRLPTWSQARAQFAESLAQLERLAQASHCRMERAEDFFSARGLGGAQAGRKRCMRCDLCYAPLVRGNTTTGFALFCEASARADAGATAGAASPASATDTDRAKLQHGTRGANAGESAGGALPPTRKSGGIEGNF